MNESTSHNQITQEAVYQPTRKAGVIIGFRECDENYLSLISKDLSLTASIDTLQYLQKQFISIGRDPTVAELYFFCSAYQREREIADADVTLSFAEGCPADASALLASFIRKYCKESGDSVNAPKLTSLAEYAASGKTRQDECGIQICKASERILPLPYSGRCETVTVGDLAVTISSGKPVSGNKRGDVCVLISPKPDDDIDAFTENVHEICRRFLKDYPETKLTSASERGLFCDLFAIFDGMVIDTALLREPSNFAESAFSVFTASLLMLPQRSALPRLWEIAAEYGVTPYAPAATRAKLITVKANEGNVEFDKSFYASFKSKQSGTLKFSDSAYIEDIGELMINSCELEHRLTLSPYTISAEAVGGRKLYENLETATSDPDATYAIAGTVNANDEAVLNALLTIDSFRRNRSPRVVYSRFFSGNKTTITVIKLKSEK